MSSFTKIYRDTLGKPELRAMAVEALYEDLDLAESKGNTKWANAIKKQLIMLGEGDYTEADHGEAPKGED